MQSHPLDQVPWPLSSTSADTWNLGQLEGPFGPLGQDMQYFPYTQVDNPAFPLNLSTLGADNLGSSLVLGDQGLPTPETSSSSHYDTNADLPPIEKVLELVHIFFDKYYAFLPVIHKQSLLSKLQKDGVDGIARVLLLAILSVSAKSHFEEQVRQMGPSWLSECKSILSQRMSTAEHPLQTLQAAVLFIFETTIQTDFSGAFLILAEAWRKSVAAGYSQIDGGLSGNMSLFGSADKHNWIEREEGRRVMWSLFMVDRGMCLPFGLAHTIDERRLVLDLPMADDDFQDCTTKESDSRKTPVRYRHDLDKLITTIQSSSRQGNSPISHFLILAYVLTGKISEELYSVDDDVDERESRMKTLVEHLVRIRLLLPRFATDFAAAACQDFACITWLNLVMNANTILLHYRPIGKDETLAESTTMASNWPHCLAAAQNTVSVLRDASRASTDFVLNANLPIFIFMSFRPIVVEYYNPPKELSSMQKKSLKDAIEVFLTVFIRQREAIGAFGQKYCNGSAFFLTQNDEFYKITKARGVMDALSTCDGWTNAAKIEDVIIPDR